MSGPAALVTGCASGIGLHLSRSLREAGYRVVATDIDHDGLARHFTEDAQHQLIRVLDVRDHRQWKRVIGETVQAWGQLDLVCNVAGYLKPGYLHECEPAEIHKHMEINAVGAMLGTRMAAEVMVAQGHGHIINIASLAGVAPIPGIGVYSASKFALRGFSLAAALELNPKGVAVTVICPDAVRTPMLDLQVDYQEAALTFSGGRFLTVEDITKAVMKQAIPKRQMEIQLPWSRGILARIASAFPGITGLLLKHLQKKGRKRQNDLKH